MNFVYANKTAYSDMKAFFKIDSDIKNWSIEFPANSWFGYMSLLDYSERQLLSAEFETSSQERFLLDLCSLNKLTGL